MVIVERTITNNILNYSVAVDDKGNVICDFGDGQKRSAEKFKGGHLVLEEGKELEIPARDYKVLSETRKQILNDINYDRTASGIQKEDPKELIRRVDKWKKKVKRYKVDGEKKEYAVHEFKIGAQSYKFHERRIASPVSKDGVLINPAYKVSKELTVGAVPVRKGELTFWRYKYEDGWKNVRPLTLNEMICVEIIRTSGMVREGKI